MAYGTNATVHRTNARRSRQPRRTAPSSREHQHRDAEPVLFPRPDERVQNRQRGDPRLPRRPQHHDAGEVFAGLRAERRQVALEAPARGKQRNRPQEHTGESCHEGEQPDADRQPGSRPHQHRQEQRRRQHHRLDPDTRGQAAQSAGEISQRPATGERETGNASSGHSPVRRLAGSPVSPGHSAGRPAPRLRTPGRSCRSADEAR